jgi:ornithine cyclodeaminase/alanine dehydrogenase
MSDLLAEGERVVGVDAKVGKSMLYLSRAEVEQAALAPVEILELTRRSLVEHGNRRVEMPAKIGLHPLPDTLIHAMPAHVPAADACGIKWSASFPQNVKKGLPQTIGVIVMNDEETGFPIAIMDSSWVTAKRTPAVSALACEALAPRETRVLTIIGCGVQGEAHLEMLPLVLTELEEIRLLDVRSAAAERLRLIARERTLNATVADDAERAVRNADVIVSATAILAKPKPFIRHEWIKQGALVLPVDFDSAWQWKTMTSADKFLVDSIDEMEYFRTIGYLPHGLPPIHAEIGEVIADLKPGRESDDELIVDMNIGMAVEDVVVAVEILERANAKGLGRLLPI